MKDRNCNNCVCWNSEAYCRNCPNKSIKEQQLSFLQQNSFTIKNQLQNKEVVRDLNEDEKEKWKEYMEDLCNLKHNPNVNVIGPAGKGHNFRTKDYLQD